MKTSIYFFSLLFTVSLLFSCEDKDNEFDREFEQSQQAWMTFKESSDNTYQYTATGSSWTGFAWETIITVSDGIVTQRDFKYTSTEGLVDDIPQEELAWTENASEIGSHAYTSAADALTLDEIYDKAQKEWLSPEGKAEIYFEADNDGMISTCGYVSEGCIDDCFAGIRIAKVEGL